MGKDLPLAHPMQVVDASIRGAGVAEVVRGPS
jgi:hypothetical protein